MSAQLQQPEQDLFLECLRESGDNKIMFMLQECFNQLIGQLYFGLLVCHLKIEGVAD